MERALVGAVIFTVNPQIVLISTQLVHYSRVAMPRPPLLSQHRVTITKSPHSLPRPPWPPDEGGQPLLDPVVPHLAFSPRHWLAQTPAAAPSKTRTIRSPDPIQHAVGEHNPMLYFAAFAELKYRAIITPLKIRWRQKHTNLRNLNDLDSAPAL